MGYIISEEEVEKIINSIGIKEKRYADKDVTASDLCFKAAEELIEKNNIDRNSIDIILFLSQSPDYKIPATAPILQHKLGLPKSTAALDLSLGCSGYVYALSTAMAYASMEGINRVLLLVGETFSKFVNQKDKVNVPLYGDAGTATLIEKSESDYSYFSLYSDGSGEDAVKIKAGEARFPTNNENLIVKEVEDGNYRSDNEIYMNGTSALHIALQLSGVQRDDEVITQALTFIATANAISYTGAHPVFLDVDKETMLEFRESFLEFHMLMISSPPTLTVARVEKTIMQLLGIGL